MIISHTQITNSPLSFVFKGRGTIEFLPNPKKPNENILYIEMIIFYSVEMIDEIIYKFTSGL